MYTMPREKNRVIRKKIEEMHKKMWISSFFFCAFALKYKLDYLMPQISRNKICESCIENNMDVYMVHTV